MKTVLNYLAAAVLNLIMAIFIAIGVMIGIDLYKVSKAKATAKIAEIKAAQEEEIRIEI